MKTNQVWKASQVFINNAPSRWIVTDKIWKGNVIADCADMESASRIAKALNEHAALVAVAEAAVQCEAAIQQQQDGTLNEEGKKLRLELALNSTRKSLANLSAVREVGAK